jgi:hypothetical protein
VLEIRLLGQFQVNLDGSAVEINSRPAQGLLAYLALNAGAAQRREKVAGLHWGRRKSQRTWRGMCDIMVKLAGEKPARENIRRYPAGRLGRTGFSRLYWFPTVS